MKPTIRAMQRSAWTALAVMFVAAAAHASDIRKGQVFITPAKNDRYTVDGSTFGKAELFGYVSDLKETQKIGGIVLKNGRKATEEQKRAVGSIGKALEIDAFVLEGRQLVPAAQ